MSRKETPKLAIIGGSGLCTFPELQERDRIEVTTKYGDPSDSIVIGTLSGQTVAFLPRHGSAHVLPPHRVPYKANLAALKDLGVERILATCIVGSLKEEIEPGHFVIPDQFVNLTWGRDDYFDVDQKVLHIPMALPYCGTLRQIAFEGAQALDLPVHPNGTVVVIQGPRFSTIAESRKFCESGWDVVNMTQYPECYFARELGLCYAAIAAVTDYDVGISKDLTMAPGKMEKVLVVFNRNVELTRQLLTHLVKQPALHRRCGCAEREIKMYYEPNLTL